MCRRGPDSSCPTRPGCTSVHSGDRPTFPRCTPISYARLVHTHLSTLPLVSFLPPQRRRTGLSITSAVCTHQCTMADASGSDVSFTAFKEPFKLGDAYSLVKQLGRGAYGFVAYVQPAEVHPPRRSRLCGGLLLCTMLAPRLST